MRVAAMLILAFGLTGCSAGVGNSAPVQGNSAPVPGNSPAPAGDRLDVYLEAVGAEARQRSHVVAFDVPGFPGIARLSIPTNHGENGERWFHGSQIVSDDQIARVALASRGWAEAKPEQRGKLAKSWIEATNGLLLIGPPMEVDALTSRDSPFQPPAIELAQDGGLTVVGWLRQVVGFGVAGGEVCYVEGHWMFSPDGTCRVSWGRQYSRSG
ncbi:MAG: hypothetical protein IT463_05895 [Planctomycetes bacterium]|nr:hypothetical protein [Planctomycetota bacterium]